jgi:hypothetical protein
VEFKDSHLVVFFVNLAVQTKMYLDYTKNPTINGIDRQKLLDYFDEFPFLEKYKNIKVAAFKAKPLRRGKITKRKAASLEVEEYGDLDEEMDDTTPNTDINPSFGA